ncbi:MAG: hypothetical protein KDA96_19480, partial [Planctomycetaceae bacterium]|nr:hypothetical protein [Planctomycetaceae bacterium]
MTIRYTCVSCESVLKIRDEKAGTNAKCPKCRTEFVVPTPEEQDSGIEIDEDVSEAPVQEESPEDDEMVDMPIDITPEVSMEEASDDFDPMDVLAGGGGDRSRSLSPAAEPPVKKPSVAELMREFESTRKKDHPKSAEAPPRAAGSAVAAAGTAADMLSRVYEQKREKASQPRQPGVEVDPEKELRNEFIRKAAAGIGIVAVLIYAMFSWMNRDIYNGPPL